jgi:hypothetical protein
MALVRLRGNSSKPWKPEDDRQLLALLRADASWPLIAATLRRSVLAVQQERGSSASLKKK